MQTSSQNNFSLDLPQLLVEVVEGEDSLTANERMPGYAREYFDQQHHHHHHQNDEQIVEPPYQVRHLVIQPYSYKHWHLVQVY